MDLAKIRQKARLEQEHGPIKAGLPSIDEQPADAFKHGIEAIRQMPEDEDFFQNIEQVNVPKTYLETIPLRQPAKRAALRDPLEAILAGRMAAGCDENQLHVSETHSEAEQVASREFLCFKVSDEIYGIDIMDIKELIKPREVTEVPRAPSFVSGIISLRGVIIPIIDMRDRLGLVCEKVTGRERVIVVRHGDSFTGLLVDMIIQVVRIAQDSIEAAPPVLEGIDRDFVTGIGRSDGRMIIILNLSSIIDIQLY
jgi:purine-binding chemotaxis protein CheW